MSPNSRPPLVGILIPAFNSAPWIAETIRSALAQTWPRKEIIVVDDGSTDDTLAVARRFASGQVAVATQPNQGAAAARNTALSMSQADVIQWLDADDLLAPDKIARQMEAGAGPAPRCHRPGEPFSTDQPLRDSAPARCGTAFLGPTGSSASCNTTRTCRPPPGSSVGS